MLKWDSAGDSAVFCFFFYQGFLSQTLTTHRTAGEGRGPLFIPIYHFHPLTNIQTFMCNFVREMTITQDVWHLALAIDDSLLEKGKMRPNPFMGALLLLNLNTYLRACEPEQFWLGFLPSPNRICPILLGKEVIIFNVWKLTLI